MQGARRGAPSNRPGVSHDKLRSDNRDRLNAAIEAITVEKNSAEWIEQARWGGSPIRTDLSRMDEVFADPQVKHIGIATPVEHPKLGNIELVGQAVTLTARRGGCTALRRKPASTPMRCCTNSATARLISLGCANAG